MREFNRSEVDVAMKIIDSGLAKAAEALSFFMKQEIRFSDLDYYDHVEPCKWKLVPKSDPNIHLLTTHIVGELSGLCCLIFSEQEAEQLKVTALPAEITSNPAAMAEMGDAVMLEADNIISASVITQFSNILRKKMHGGVPELRKVSFNELNDFITQERKKERYSLNFKTRFTTASGNFSPEFLWLLDKEFVESIKDVQP